jgi:hypothetical protein
MRAKVVCESAAPCRILASQNMATSLELLMESQKEVARRYQKAHRRTRSVSDGNVLPALATNETSSLPDFGFALP